MWLIIPSLVSMPNRDLFPGIFVEFGSHGSPQLPEPATHNWSHHWNIIFQKRSRRCPHICDILVSRGGRAATFDNPGLNTTPGQHDPYMEPTYETNLSKHFGGRGANTDNISVRGGGRACWIVPGDSLHCLRIWQRWCQCHGLKLRVLKGEVIAIQPDIAQLVEHLTVD